MLRTTTKILCVSSILIFSSCSNLLSSILKDTDSSSTSTSAKATINAEFTNYNQTASSDSSDSRSAFPVNDTTSDSYLVFRMLISGCTGYELVSPESGTMRFDFNPAEITGTHTVTFYGIPYNADNSKITANNAVVSASQEVAFVSGKQSYDLSMKLTTVSGCTTKGTYTVSITRGTTAITSVTAKLLQGSAKKYSSDFTFSNNKATVTLYPAGGEYTLLLLYYSSDDSLLYTDTDDVTVWPTLTTTGTALTVSSAFNKLYVRGSDIDGAFYKTNAANISGLKAASNSNTGGVADPYADLQPAINSIIASGQSGTIYVDGTVTYSSTGSNGTNAMVDMGGSSGNSSYTGTVTIKRMSSVNAVIDGGSTKRVMYVNMSGSGAEIDFEHITLQKGSSNDEGGGMYIKNGTVSMNACTVTGCKSRDGGGVYNSNGIFTITDTVIGTTKKYTSDTCVTSSETASSASYGNSSTNGGGIYNDTGTVKIIGLSSVSYNYASTSGGGIYNNNGIINLGSITDSKPSVLLNNSTSGGGIYFKGTSANGKINIYGSVHHNAATNGGGVTFSTTETTVPSITVNSSGGINYNCASSNGGGIYLSAAKGTLALLGSVCSNTAANGGGLYVSAGTVTLTNDSTVGAAVTTTNGTQDSSVAATSDLHSNYASENGGGIYLAGGEVDLKGASAVSYNYAANGGGVYVSGGTLNVGSSATDANAQVYANGTGGRGGGIFNNGGTANIYGTIHHNKGQNASGIYVCSSTILYGSATIRDNYTAATEKSSGCVVVEGDSAAFTMNDSSVLSNNGCIINKTYNQYEGYVASGTFTMSGSAVVKATANVYNSVYLTGGKYITVSDTLTPSSNTAAGSPSLSAMIMPSSYTSNDSSSTVQMLQASASAALTAAIPHFDVVRAGGCITASTTDATKGVLNCVASVGTTPTYYYSLGLAVDAVSSGGTVTLCKSFTMNSMFTVNKNFTLATGGLYIITRSSALTASPLFTVSSGSTLTLNTSDAANTLTLDGGTGIPITATAPLIVNKGTLNVNKCTLQNNNNDYTKTNGTAPDSTGGGVYSTGTLNLNTGSTISGCRAYYGGGVYSTGTLNLNTDSTISGCRAYYGGAVYSAGGTLTMNGGIIGDSTKTTAPTNTESSNASNSANETGGAVYASAGTVDLKGGTICYNSACYNGALSIASGVSFTLEGTSVAYNTAQDSGGGIALYCAAPSITGGSVYGNKVTNTSGTSGNGGGVYYSCSGGTLTMSGGTVGGADASKANAAANGGGVYVASGTMTLNGGTVGIIATSTATDSAYANKAALRGGGVYCAGTLNMDSGYVYYNYSAENEDSYAYLGGGGIYISGTMNMNGGTVGYNSSYSGGGGIACALNSTFNGKSGTITYNKACCSNSYEPDKTGGGGIYLYCVSSSSYGDENNLLSITNNTSIKHGGGIFIVMNNGTHCIYNIALTDNTASGKGGGLYLTDDNSTANGILWLESDSGDASITKNTASGYGGGIANYLTTGSSDYLKTTNGNYLQPSGNTATSASETPNLYTSVSGKSITHTGAAIANY